MSPAKEGIQAGIRQIGKQVLQYRLQKGYAQEELAKKIGRSRNTIALLEQGRRLPSPDDLDKIAEVLDIPHQQWQVLSHHQYMLAHAFQDLLAELLGKPLDMESLDPIAQRLLITQIHTFLSREQSPLTPLQACKHFNSLLTFFGEHPVTPAFYNYFWNKGNFEQVAEFEQALRRFQQDAMRIFGSFRKAFKTLSALAEHELTPHLQALAPLPLDPYYARRPFTSIQHIERDRLDDLGYISVERVRKQNRERTELSQRLKELAHWIETHGEGSVLAFDDRKLHRIQTLLRKFESPLEIEETLFRRVDPESVRREARHLAPENEDLARIADTQERGMQNLSAYLTESNMDVYIATSMRERADFISVNAFVETIFKDPRIAPLHLRYFNPTLSWVADRVAKGLVEALMLKRASLTVYMAQKTDTFGKDSEASVALGQGKPVIVYVPRLYDQRLGINSEKLMAQSEAKLQQQFNELNLDIEENLDKQGWVEQILKARLKQLNGEALARLVDQHWADFDLYGEVQHLPTEQGQIVQHYLDTLTLNRKASTPRPEPPIEIQDILIQQLVKVSLLFEKRAHTFKEVHPLALQVILSSGVLNGILVVRSAKACTRMIYELLTNTLNTELRVDEKNYRLIEKHSGSTLRVISRHRLLTNAFWTQYFSL